MDLDPKGANNQIKEAIDKRYVTEEDDPGAGKAIISPNAGLMSAQRCRRWASISPALGSDYIIIYVLNEFSTESLSTCCICRA